jgi:peroxiredoxin
MLGFHQNVNANTEESPRKESAVGEGNHRGEAAAPPLFYCVNSSPIMTTVLESARFQTDSLSQTMPRPFRTRILVLPVAAIVITGLVVWKIRQPPQERSTAMIVERRLAPKFSALDSHNKLRKLDTYLGRFETLLVFFDGEAGADHDPDLMRVRQQYEELNRRGIRVVGVSAAIPQFNRQAAERSGEFPFPLLSDPEFFIHRMWGRYDEDQLRTHTGVFWIDRAGHVAWSGQFPRPEENLDQILPSKSAPPETK